jgi:hypothetical protein
MQGFDALQTEVIARLGNRTDIASRSTRWLNYAFFELVMNPRFSFHELDTSTTFVTVAAERNYTLPTDIWFILSLRDNTNSRKLKMTHWSEFDRITYTTGQPVRYAHFSNYVELDPTPDAAYTIQVRYRFRPSDEASGTAFVNLGTEWEEVIVNMATMKGFEALDQRAKAGELRQLIEIQLSTRQDAFQLDDMDSETTIMPALMPVL